MIACRTSYTSTRTPPASSARSCAPLLLDEVRKSHPHLVVAFCKVVGMHHAPEGPEPVRASTRSRRDLQRHPALQDAAFQKTVLRYRFGVFLYREIRCQLVHEAVESTRVAHPTHGRGVSLPEHVDVRRR